MSEWEDSQERAALASERDRCDYYGYQVNLTNAQQNELNVYLAKTSESIQLDIDRAIMEWAIHNPNAMKEDVVASSIAVRDGVGKIFFLTKDWCLKHAAED